MRKTPPAHLWIPLELTANYYWRPVVDDLLFFLCQLPVRPSLHDQNFRAAWIYAEPAVNVKSARPTWHFTLPSLHRSGDDSISYEAVRGQDRQERLLSRVLTVQW